MGKTNRCQAAIPEGSSNPAGAIPRLFAKIDLVLRQPRVAQYQAIEVKSIAVRVEHLFLAIQEAAARKDLDRLLANVDRLQREVGAGNAMLDRTLDREKA